LKNTGEHPAGYAYSYLGSRWYAAGICRAVHKQLDNGYIELHISGGHVLAISSLPPIHKDPFDRILLEQALTRYGGAVICV
jgi:hypothetical protein